MKHYDPLRVVARSCNSPSTPHTFEKIPYKSKSPISLTYDDSDVAINSRAFLPMPNIRFAFTRPYCITTYLRRQHVIDIDLESTIKIKSTSNLHGKNVVYIC